jgi:hypothetical protein
MLLFIEAILSHQLVVLGLSCPYPRLKILAVTRYIFKLSQHASFFFSEFVKLWLKFLDL